MIILAYNKGGGHTLLLLRRCDAAANAEIHLAAGAHLRVLDGCNLQDLASTVDKRIPETIEAFDRLYPHQPAITE